MNEHTRETLSALIDGELTSNEISKAVNKLTESDDLCGHWDRYNVIGDIIRGEEIRSEYRAIADGVKDKLRDEPAILAPPRRSGDRFKPQWVKPAAGSALAASVAAIALLAAPQFINEDPSQSPLLTSAKTPPPEQLYAAQSGTRWNLSKPDVESKLNAYLVNHQAYAPLRSVKGMLPYVTFVSYDMGR
jgi:sigma-E factor negative regulatory protein RseA